MLQFPFISSFGPTEAISSVQAKSTEKKKGQDFSRPLSSL